MTLVLGVPSQFWNPLISEVHVPCSSRGMSSITICYSRALPVASSALVPFLRTQGSGVTRSTGFSWTKLISDAGRIMVLMGAVVCHTLPWPQHWVWCVCSGEEGGTSSPWPATTSVGKQESNPWGHFLVKPFDAILPWTTCQQWGETVSWPCNAVTCRYWLLMILFLVHFYLHATFQSLGNIEKYWLKECKRNVNHGLSCFEELKKFWKWI